jgi:hypothetical protein
MTAISRNKVKIWIVSAGTAPSTLVNVESSSNTHAGYISGQIKSYSKSGGDSDVESDPVFGGFVDKEKPTTQVELAFDIVPAMEAANADRWDYYSYTEETVGAKTVYTMASDNLDASAVAASDKAVFIQALNGTDYKTIAVNNAQVTVLDMEHNADDNRTYSMTMKFSPTNSSGVSNFMTGKLSATSMPNWSQLNNA